MKRINVTVKLTGTNYLTQALLDVEDGVDVEAAVNEWVLNNLITVEHTDCTGYTIKPDDYECQGN